VPDRSLRFDLVGRDKSLGSTLRKGERDTARFGNNVSRHFDRAGHQAGTRFGLRLNKSLGGGMSASAGIVRKGAGLIGAGFAAAGIASFAKDAVDLAATFDKTMRQTAQVAKVPARQMAELRDVALDMGAKTSFSAKEAGNAMLALGKGGLTFAEMKAGALNSTLTLAAAGGLELGQSAEFVVQGLRTFGLRADKAAAVAAALAGAANASTSSVEDMGLALSQTGAGARNAGLSIQETTGVLAAFANNGIKGADAGTSLKTMLTRLVPTTVAAKNKMKDLNLSFVDSHGAILPITEIAQKLQDRLAGMSQAQRSAALATIFGSDATRAATVLMREGSKGLAKYIKATSDRSAAEKLAKTNTEGAAGAFERLQGAIETVKIKAGTSILPMLADVATTIADRVIPAIARWVNQFRSDLLPHLGRMKDAWDANKGALAGLVTGLAGSESQLTSTGGKARTLADSVVALSNAAGDTSRALTSLGDGLNSVEAASDRWGSSIFKNVVDPANKAVKAAGEWLGINQLVGGVARDVSADLADVGIRFGKNADATAKSTGAADRHTTALRAEKDAVNALKSALAGEETAELDVRQAKLNVSTAQRRLTELVKGGRKGSLEYRQAQIDLQRAQIDLKNKTDDYKAAQHRATAATGGAAHAAQAAQGPYQTFGKKAHDAGIKALNMGHNARDGILMIPKDRVSRITAKFGWQGLEVFRSPGVGIGGRGGLLAQASGGYINGPGTETSDSIPARLSKGEYVVRAKAVRAVGRDTLDDINAQGFATGGPVLDARIPSGTQLRGPVARFLTNIEKVLDLATARFKKLAGKFGGGKPGVLNFIRSVDPLPYRWGAAGPGAYDCSGLVSAVYGKHTGRGGGHGQRYFTTSTISASGGLKPGLGGTLQIGVTPARGHMVGRYGGLGFEAESSRTGIKVGRAATRPESMARHFHMAAGGLVEEEFLAALAATGRFDIGGDRGKLRVNGQTFDAGGWLQPGTTVAHNRTGRPERVSPPGGEVINYTKLARVIVDALHEHPPAVYLDGQKVDRRLRTAAQWNERRR
jgi:TP901 family phage tail tape measure protein